MSDALLEAIQTRDVDRVAQLLASGADPNEDGKSRYGGYSSGRTFPLQASIGELEAFGEDDAGGPEPAGPIDAVVLLLRHGAKVTAWEPEQNGDPLFISVCMNQVEAVRLLLADMRGWLPLLTRDIPQFDPSSFADKPDVPDDILEDANRLLDTLDTATDADGKSLDYAANAINLLNASLTAANKEWAEAESADSHYQKLLANVRATAAVFDLELQTFRRSLSHVAGRNDKDFQKLRAERASTSDDDDDPNAPPPPAPVTPTP